MHRGIHYLSEVASELYEQAHEKAAKFLGGEGMENMIFTRNTTESLNLLAYTLGLTQLNPGDKIVITGMEHHSNIVPWQQIAKRVKAELTVIDVTPNGTIDMNSAEKAIDDKTKVVSIMHVSNVLGTINPVKEIGKLAHEHGAYFIVDGAQSVPHMRINVKEIDADFYAFSGHKMLAPMGIGGLYGKTEILEEMEPFLFGGDMISQVSFEESKWNSLPWKFEAGTPNVNGGIGLMAAIEYLENLGMENVEKLEREILTYAFKQFQEREYLEIYGPPLEQRGAVISFNLQGVHPHDVASILDEHGIAIRAGHHCAQPLINKLKVAATARASFYIYNTKEEVDKLMEALDEAHKLFKSF